MRLRLTTGGKYIFMEAFPTGDPDNPFFTTSRISTRSDHALVACTLGQTTVSVRRLITPVR